MASWWNTAGASNFTRGLTTITGQLSNNLKDILSEASEETFDPVAELTRARQQIEDLELRRQALTEECTSLKKQNDELTMQKQAAEIKSDMLLAESRRAIEDKDKELKLLRANTTTTTATWDNANDLNNTWTDILADDQPEINEYLRYQRTIRDLKDENNHLREEMANLRKSVKAQQAGKNQSRRENEIAQLEQTHAEQLSKCRQEYDEQMQQLQARIAELENWNKNQQEEELRKSMEVQKEADDVDKDLLSQELEQANQKLSWYNDKLKDFSDLQSKIDLLVSNNKQLEDDLQLEQHNHRSALERIEQLQQELDQHKARDHEQQAVSQNNEELARLLNEERQRCDALAADNDAMFRLLEETRAQNERHTKEKEKQIEEVHAELQHLRQQMETEKNDWERRTNEEKATLTAQVDDLQQFKDEHLARGAQEDESRTKELQVREMLERQLIEVNEDLQAFENEKSELYNQIEQLKDQLHAKEKRIQTLESTPATPTSLAVTTPVSDSRARSPSPQTFEHVLELEAQILRHEQHFRDLNSIYDRFVTLLPIELSSADETSSSLADRFTHLFEQWSTYVDTLSITQQELDSVKQLLIEKQDDLEKLQFDLDLTTTKLVELQQLSSPSLSVCHANQSSVEEENEDELENILDLHPFAQRAPSRQSIVSSTPGEKQQLIAQNELLSSLLAEKERELISLQQAEKTREELLKNIELLKKNLQQMELDKEVKQVELNDIRNVLDEKLRETSSLKKEKMYFIEKLAELEREKQEQQPMIQVSSKQASQDEDKPASPTVAKTEEVPNVAEVHTQEQFDKLRSDYDQLVDFSKKQHDESLSYYNEYARILALHNELNSKHSQLQIDYESLQSLIQQKNEAYLQCQNELNNYQNLLYHEKKKSEEADLLRATLTEREAKLQQMVEHETTLLVRQSELERDLKLLEQANFELKSAEQTMIEQLQQSNSDHMNFDRQKIAHDRDAALAEKRLLESDLESTRQRLLQCEERERKYAAEIDRLRNHLLKMEESYTTDLIAAEDREKTLRNQIAQLDDSNRAQNELIQQLNTSGEQSKQTLATELGTLKYEYSKLEALNTNLNNQLQYQMKCSQNLQNVLEQFKREREQHINDHLRQYQDALREQTSLAARLTTENNDMRTRLAEYNEALSAAQRLNGQIEKKDALLATFRRDVHEKDQLIQQYEHNLRDLQSTSGSRVEKQLVKNILLSFFHTPVDKRQEVIPLLGALVGFTQEEYRKAIDANSAGQGGGGGRAGAGWLSGWLGGAPAGAGPGTNLARTRTQSETPAYDPNKSFTELLIQYVDQQSVKNPQHPAAKFNTDEYLQRYDSTIGGGAGAGHLLRKPSLSASANPFVNSSSLSLNRPTPPVVLPTTNSASLSLSSVPLPPPLSSAPTPTTATSTSESSSTILKDLLKS